MPKASISRNLAQHRNGAIPIKRTPMVFGTWFGCFVRSPDMESIRKALWSREGRFGGEVSLDELWSLEYLATTLPMTQRSKPGGSDYSR
jgi:hypothetical protein